MVMKNMPLNKKRCLLSFLVFACFLMPYTVSAGAPSVYREIESINILEQAKSSTVADAKICSGFRLSSQRVKAVLQTAREIDVRSYANDLDVSPCTVEGQVTLRNGLKGNWQIQMGGGIQVEFEDQHIMLLYCKRCGKPFTD
jgi:hypothetical protein